MPPHIRSLCSGFLGYFSATFSCSLTFSISYNWGTFRFPVSIFSAFMKVVAEYAKKIGADWYAKDAKQSADIAKEFFGV